MPSARRVRWARFRTSVVSLVAGAIVITLAYLLTGGTLFHREARVYLYLPDATGIGAGSPVRVDGIGVGKVESVALAPATGDPNRVVRVVMSVEAEHLRDIPIDSWAQLNTETMVGDRFVAVSSGSSPQRVRANEEISYRAQPELMQNLDLREFDQRLRVMEGVITDIEQGRGRVGQLVVGTATYTELLRRLAELERAMQQARSATTSVGSVLYSDATYNRVRNLAMSLDQSLARLQAGAMLRDSAQYDRFQTAAVNLRQSTAKLRAAPFAASGRTYENWNRTLAQWIQRIDEFNSSPAMAGSQSYESLTGAVAEIGAALREFRGNPQKFLRIGVF